MPLRTFTAVPQKLQSAKPENSLLLTLPIILPKTWYTFERKDGTICMRSTSLVRLLTRTHESKFFMPVLVQDSLTGRTRAGEVASKKLAPFAFIS